MSLQSIMDATPIVSWTQKRFGEYIGSTPARSYLIADYFGGHILYWYEYPMEELSRFTAKTPQEIINKINELEGIK